MSNKNDAIGGIFVLLLFLSFLFYKFYLTISFYISPIGILLSLLLLYFFRNIKIRLGILILILSIVFVTYREFYVSQSIQNSILNIASIYNKYFSYSQLIETKGKSTLLFLNQYFGVDVFIYSVAPAIISASITFSLLFIILSFAKKLYFRFKWRTDDPKCNGIKSICSQNRGCAYSDRLFCQNVMSKIFELGNFRAQFPILLPSGVKYLDFVFLTEDNIPVAIEVDDIGTHGNDIGYRAFNAHLTRQNELILKGLKILRFSFNQAKYESDKCIDSIRWMNPKIGTHIVGMLPEIFFDISSSVEMSAKRYSKLCNRIQGAQYSKIRRKWYLLEGQESLVLPVGLNLEKKWTPCRRKEERDGKMYFKEDAHRTWWRCSVCKTIYYLGSVSK